MVLAGGGPIAHRTVTRKRNHPPLAPEFGWLPAAPSFPALRPRPQAELRNQAADLPAHLLIGRFVLNFAIRLPICLPICLSVDLS